MLTEVNFRAPCNLLGFGLFSFTYFKHMSKFAKVNWEVIGGSPDAKTINKLCSEFGVRISVLASAIARPLNPDLPLFTIWHHHDLQHENYDVRALIHFETSTFTPAEVESISKVTKVGACSDWGLDTIIDNVEGMNPDILPGIYASIETKDSPAVYNHNGVGAKLKEHFEVDKLFVSGGKWETRKQHFRLLEPALADATPNKVMILGLWNNVFTGGLTEPMKALVDRGYQKTERIELSMPGNEPGELVLDIYRLEKSNISFALCPFIESMPLMHSIYRASDGYISISAGEGWDQPLVEAMSLGVPCLATNNTAHSEYITFDNSVRVQCEKEIAYDGQFFMGNKGMWYPPHHGSLLSQWIYFCIEDLTEIGDNAKNDMIKRHREMSISLENTLGEYLK